ncbi:MAG: protein kinase, partial [Planctomycetota bacterium]|nr:protein kinase [Planctomycetota bacterium]
MDKAERIESIIADCQDRRARGERIDVEELVRRSPEIAEELRFYLEVSVLFDSAVAGGSPESGDRMPREIGDFRLIREVGRGGMGVVYEAEQISMRRTVALKVLSLAITGAGHAVKRFEREAQAAGRLHHTNIVPVYAMGQYAGYWYYAMELVRGRPLDRVVKELRALRGRPSEESLARLVGSTPEASPSSRAPESSAAQRITGTGERAYF